MVSALTLEVHSPQVQDWLGRQGLQRCVVSTWVVAELSSALSIKLRTRQITLNDRAAALTALHQLLDESMTIVPVHDAAFRLATHFADRHELGIRSGEALHLAICAEAGFTLCTLDRRLAQAGPALGVSVALIGS